MRFIWEEIQCTLSDNCEYGSNTDRAKIFGGWLVKHRLWDNLDKTDCLSLVFVPDKNHEWKIE